MMSNYTPPAVEILYLNAEQSILTASKDGPEGLFHDKWTDVEDGSFY